MLLIEQLEFEKEQFWRITQNYPPHRTKWMREDQNQGRTTGYIFANFKVIVSSTILFSMVCPPKFE